MGKIPHNPVTTGGETPPIPTKTKAGRGPVVQLTKEQLAKKSATLSNVASPMVNSSTDVPSANINALLLLDKYNKSNPKTRLSELIESLKQEPEGRIFLAKFLKYATIGIMKREYLKEDSARIFGNNTQDMEMANKIRTDDPSAFAAEVKKLIAEDIVTNDVGPFAKCSASFKKEVQKYLGGEIDFEKFSEAIAGDKDGQKFLKDLKKIVADCMEKPFNEKGRIARHDDIRVKYGELSGGSAFTKLAEQILLDKTIPDPAHPGEKKPIAYRDGGESQFAISNKQY
ncbi:MAG: hypothetical protein WC838_07260, partial [Candidatus Margulisiibacteriota bacterium]